MTRKCTAEEVEKILDDKLATFQVTLIATLKKHFDDNYGAQIRQNTENIAQLTERVNKLEQSKTDLDEEMKSLREENSTLKDDLDDQINRGMRNNLIIKGIAESSGDERENTREIVKETLAPLIPSYSVKDIDDVIDRAHRGGKRKNPARGPRNIYVKFQFSSHVDEFMDAIKTKRARFRLERQFYKAVTDRRNLAMLERKTLKMNKEIRSGYIEYPAKLMVKRNGETTYKLHKEF